MTDGINGNGKKKLSERKLFRVRDWAEWVKAVLVICGIISASYATIGKPLLKPLFAEYVDDRLQNSHYLQTAVDKHIEQKLEKELHLSEQLETIIDRLDSIDSRMNSRSNVINDIKLQVASIDAYLKGKGIK